MKMIVRHSPYHQHFDIQVFKVTRKISAEKPNCIHLKSSCTGYTTMCHTDLLEHIWAVHHWGKKSFCEMKK